jgi:hypothetical protein
VQAIDKSERLVEDLGADETDEFFFEVEEARAGRYGGCSHRTIGVMISE